jgi:hypothetical protein
MSRRSLILCLVALAVLILGTGAAVAFLYSGTDGKKDRKEIRGDRDAGFALLSAVPSDAVMLACFSNAGAAPSGTYDDIVLPQSSAKSEAVVSMHYSGKLMPLYVFDAGKSGDASTLAGDISRIAASKGLYSESFDCSDISTDRKIASHSIVLVSPSKDVVKSSIRHLKAGESVIKISDFAMASSKVSGNNLLFVSNTSSHNLFPAFLVGRFAKSSDFFRRLSDWMAVDVTEIVAERTSFTGSLVSDSKEPDMISVLSDCGAAASEVSAMLPSYTVSVMTLPLKKRTQFIASYQNFLDSKQGLQRKLIQRNLLADSTGVTPEDFCERLEITEVATAAFVVNGSLQRVNLAKLNSVDAKLLFAGTGVTSLKNYTPAVHPYQYESYISSVFGDMFSLKDESSFTYIDGWVVSGSDAAVSEYASGRALSYNLKEYMANADLPDMLSEGTSSFKAYLSLTEDMEALSVFADKEVVRHFSKLYNGVDYSGIVLSAGKNGDPESLSIDMFRNTIRRSKAPVAERNTVISVSRGPFKVKNSHTGKMNSFYQRQANNYLCLNDENGKGMWGVPFDKPICGTAQTVDFYNNGKLQILFGAGSRLYLIDRLGRFVQDCNVDLKKDILLGPDVYDFAGKRKYNVMVLHMDNTIEMYNLQGERPSSWTTISAPETVTGLPERVDLSGKTFWIVRTAVQTLIYPFGGGQPLTDFKGDQMILPGSKILVKDSASVEVECYDGKKRTVKLK